ncbi:DUF2798 domain-containing protein [Burkholderia stabilis]|uniref:DUF2798 domain-containing protein n=1 Tax=Burkholderia stabilis TaxID=95485 RepID=UPI0009F44ECB|nr:DUF2798 domain-containing protein [Burkholderia stabilis]
MFKIPSRYSHFAYGVIQAGLTCSISAAISSIPLAEKGLFFQQWLMSWSTSWLVMLPVVLLAAPFVRHMVEGITSNS